MNQLLAPLTAFASVALAACAQTFPISAGQHTFQHRFYEHPSIPSIELTARIKDSRIVLINATDSDVFPKGVVADGTLMWHTASKQWIIGSEPSDSLAEEVGGCSDGPEVVDLSNRTYWTC